jgi:hypothetical protein
MKKIVRKTGDYGIGIMIHSVHMTDDVPALNRFYEDVFGGLMYMGVDEPNFLPVEDRWAGLLLVSDLCIETMAPNMPADPTKPVGKFYTKFGRHLHSVGYKVDDLVGLGNHLIEQGVYIGAPGGGKLDHIEESMTYFYPSPRDMYARRASGPPGPGPACWPRVRTTASAPLTSSLPSQITSRRLVRAIPPATRASVYPIMMTPPTHPGGAYGKAGPEVVMTSEATAGPMTGAPSIQPWWKSCRAR